MRRPLREVEQVLDMRDGGMFAAFGQAVGEWYECAASTTQSVRTRCLATELWRKSSVLLCDWSQTDLEA
jgi:hypothetical protein